VQADRARAWDPHLEAGAETALEQLRPATRASYLELTAAVADGFTDTNYQQGGEQ
jgi:hypothetical protein